jgi:hypothetical protein
LLAFVQALAALTGRPHLLELLPSGPAVESRGTPPPAAAPCFRRLIIRVVERRLSPRGERQQGRRCEIQIHRATTPRSQGGCCGGGCSECIPGSAEGIQTVRARVLDAVHPSALKDQLQEEIEDILLTVFEDEQPDLVQIIVPEALLPAAIFDDQLHRIPVWGAQRLFVRHLTVFCGQERSDRRKHGRLLLGRLAPEHERWSPSLAHVSSAADDLDLKRKLQSGEPAVVVTGDRRVTELCVNSEIPVIVVSFEPVGVGGIERVRACIAGTGCLRRLPRALHDGCHDIAVIYDTPNVPLHFAEEEQPVVVGR